MGPELYGLGMAFPAGLEVSGPGVLGVARSSGPRRIAESIHVILGTQYGERLMRPRFGANLRSLVFAPNNQATADLAQFYVEDALRRWEPRIEVVAVAVANDTTAATLRIDITYRLRATGDQHGVSLGLALEPTA